VLRPCILAATLQHKLVYHCALLQVLTAKCLGRRICRDCGKNFNVADIMLPASNGQPEVRMPPLNPPENCREKMEIRSDDNLATINNRIDVSSVVTLSNFVELSHNANMSSYLSRYLSNKISSIMLTFALDCFFCPYKDVASSHLENFQCDLHHDHQSGSKYI